jgi:FMN-dependent NADH-azoreductase
MSDTHTILRLDASARHTGSIGRGLTGTLIDKLLVKHAGAHVIARDLAVTNIPYLDEAWLDANTTPAAQRTPQQQDALSFSDELVAELKSADILVIACPIYNFSVPAALKAWIDQVCRSGLTFNYSPNGPVGLLENKKAYIVITSGGTEVGSAIDFTSGYLRHIMGFIGIKDVTFVAADRLMIDADASLAKAHAAIEKL